MNRKLFLSILVVSVFSFALSVKGERTYGWGKPIKLSWELGGPNVLVKETIGLTVSDVSLGSYNAFGYFSYSPVTGVLTENAINFDSNGQAYIGEFAPGTYVGTWLTSDYGKFYSANIFNVASEDASRSAFMGDTPEGNLTIGLYGGYKWADNDLETTVVAFEPTRHAPAGQPLPGIMISTLIGLGFSGIAGIKMRRNSHMA